MNNKVYYEEPPFNMLYSATFTHGSLHSLFTCSFLCVLYYTHPSFVSLAESIYSIELLLENYAGGTDTIRCCRFIIEPVGWRLPFAVWPQNASVLRGPWKDHRMGSPSIQMEMNRVVVQWDYNQVSYYALIKRNYRIIYLFYILKYWKLIHLISCSKC